MSKTEILALGFQEVVIDNIKLLKDSLENIYDESERIALANLLIETQQSFQKFSDSSRSYRRCFNILQKLSRQWLNFLDKYKTDVENNVSLSKYIYLVTSYISAYSQVFRGLVYLHDKQTVYDLGVPKALSIGLALIAESFEIFMPFFSIGDLDSLLKIFKDNYALFSPSRTVDEYFNTDREENLLITQIKSVCIYSIFTIEEQLSYLSRKDSIQDSEGVDLDKQLQQNKAALSLIDSWRSKETSSLERKKKKEDFDYFKKLIDEHRPDGQKVFS